MRLENKIREFDCFIAAVRDDLAHRLPVPSPLPIVL